MDFTAFKALHLVFMVAWFAGLFYMPRLFVYHSEASRKENPARDILSKQFKTMENRLWYIITWPSCILTLGFGIAMLVVSPAYLKMPWMHLKLAFVFALFLYHLNLGRFYRKFQRDEFPGNSMRFRLINEIATILLIAIVFVVVYKNLLNWIWGVAGILGIAVLLTVSIMLYKKRRKKKEQQG